MSRRMSRRFPPMPAASWRWAGQRRTPRWHRSRLRAARARRGGRHIGHDALLDAGGPRRELLPTGVHRGVLAWVAPTLGLDPGTCHGHSWPGNGAQSAPMLNARDLMAQFQALPPERIAEIEDFVEFIAVREQERSLTRAAAAASAFDSAMSSWCRSPSPATPSQSGRAGAGRSPRLNPYCRGVQGPQGACLAVSCRASRPQARTSSHSPVRSRHGQTRPSQPISPVRCRC